MKKTYIVGFFAVVFIFIMLLSAGYRISYEYVAERNARLENETADTGTVTAEGAAVKENDENENDGYILCEMQGFVVVYLSDGKTIYEMTEIPVTDLPEEIQQEIAVGKNIGTKEELYGFLENYSS